jgi:hypothetical protein
MPSMPSRMARRAVATKPSRTRFNPAASRACGGTSPAPWGIAEGASVSQPSTASGAICAPPSQGARLDALRPAWLIWIATGIGA